MVNFDCAASAPVLPCAREAFLSAPPGNPNSVHAIGRQAREALENARHDIAECIGAEAKEIVFTSGATSACRLAVELFDISIPNPHDHKAVYDASMGRASRMRFHGEAVSNVRSIPLVSNETGRFFSEEIEEEIRWNGHEVFTDATAAMGHVGINVRELGVKALSAGAHKFGGYPGIGFLYVRGGFADFFDEADRDHHPGTPPVALACAMAAALKHRVRNLGMAEELFQYRTWFVELLRKTIPDMEINTPFSSVPTILSVRFDGINARELLTAMEMRGLCASAGAACSSGSDEPSRPLLAHGLTPEQALSTVRLSFCEETTTDDFLEAASIVSKSVLALRSAG